MVDAANSTDEQLAKAIKNLQKSEKHKRQWRRINKVSGKSKRGVRMIYIPNKDSEGNLKWDTISEKNEMEEKIREQNVQHLNQCKKTPFSEGDFI